MRAPATAARSEAHWASRPPAGARGSTGRAARPRGGIIFSHEKERGAAAHDRMGDGQSAVTVTRRGRAWDPLPHPHHPPTREGPRTGKSSDAEMVGDCLALGRGWGGAAFEDENVLELATGDGCTTM